MDSVGVSADLWYARAGGWQDATTPTGRRVVYPQAAFPVDREGVSFPPDVWSRLDGFSVTTAAIAYFANLSLAESRVPGWQDMARSLDDDCPTILLDAVTGERLAHFAELDFSTEVAAPRRAVPLRTGVRARCALG